MLSKLQHACKYIEQGISIIPLHHRSKEPCLPSWREFTTRLPSDTEYHSWLASGWANYGVVCGWDNLVVIDFDDMETFNLWSLWVSGQGIDTQYVRDKSFKVRTARGMHVYVTSWETIPNSRRRHIDIQAQGKYVVGPESVHPSGHVYESIGAMVFPVVFDLNEILPLDLFPLVAPENVEFTGAPIAFPPNTEYQVYDPFAAASASTDFDLITKVKSSVRIESLFADLKRTSTDGRWLATWCPFHNDKRSGGTMSFWIDTARQLCGCNVCNMRPMDVINLFAKMHNVSESVAVSALAQEVGVWS